MTDVKEILEVLEAVKLVAIPVKAALKDGIDVSDLPKLLEIIEKYKVIIAAVDNISEVVEEVKDIDTTEAAIIVAKVIEIIKELKAA